MPRRIRAWPRALPPRENSTILALGLSDWGGLALGARGMSPLSAGPDGTPRPGTCPPLCACPLAPAWARGLYLGPWRGEVTAPQEGQGRTRWASGRGWRNMPDPVAGPSDQGFWPAQHLAWQFTPRTAPSGSQSHSNHARHWARPLQSQHGPGRFYHASCYTSEECKAQVSCCPDSRPGAGADGPWAARASGPAHL